MPICDVCDENQGQHCGVCSTDSCQTCRERMGSNDRCPNCGNSVADNAKCSVTGGCGDGRQEGPT